MTFTAAVLLMVVASGKSEGKLAWCPLLPALILTLAALTLTLGNIDIDIGCIDIGCIGIDIDISCIDIDIGYIALALTLATLH